MGTVDCDCGSKRTDQYSLVCPLNPVSSTPYDLTNATDAAIQVARVWSNKRSITKQSIYIISWIR